MALPRKKKGLIVIRIRKSRQATPLGVSVADEDEGTPLVGCVIDFGIWKLNLVMTEIDDWAD